MVAECWTLDDTPPKLYTQPPTLPSTSGKFSSTNKSIDVDIHGFAFLNPLTVHLNAVVSNCLKKKKKDIAKCTGSLFPPIKCRTSSYLAK